MDYYEILGLDFFATLGEIKASFRNRLKLLHPDMHRSFSVDSLTESMFDVEGEKTSSTQRKSELLELIQAYEVLSNPVKRKLYDDQCGKSEKNLKRRKRVFDYERFLCSRQHIFSYKAKLYLFDLVYRNGETAAEIYEEILEKRKKILLKVELGRLDYIDSLFLLAEVYQKRETAVAYKAALRLYLELFTFEKKYSYFKEYCEVLAENVVNIIELLDAAGECDDCDMLISKLLDEIEKGKFPQPILQKATHLRKQMHYNI